jgi:putative phosphonate metabolism protein
MTLLRYALYFTPPQDHPLSRAAQHWLGSDPFTGGVCPQVAVPGFPPEELRDLTADPRRYGFHGTLKAPFELAAGKTEMQLLQALDEFSAECETFEIPEMKLGQLGPFFALVPSNECTALQILADETVRRFEPFRAPLSQADIARRKPEELTEAGRRNLETWGYPYVFDDFRFHMTLTGKVPVEQRPAMRAALGERFGAFIGQPLIIDTLALFVEPHRGAPFTVHSLLPLGGTSKRKIS